MHNILKIFRTDLRRIMNNVVAVVIIMGLSILPALYAWFNIFSNWDPYEPAATSQLKVAVASDDVGANLLGISMNVGENVVTALESNTTIGCVPGNLWGGSRGCGEQRILCGADYSGGLYRGNAGLSGRRGRPPHHLLL